MPTNPVGNGTRRMAQRLAQLAQESIPLQNRFQTVGRIRELQRMASTTQLLPAEARVLQFQLATELLNGGRNREALELFQRLSAETPVANTPAQVANLANLQVNIALCHLRIAEQLNCLSNHTSESCLLPIRGGGVHRMPSPSRQAIGVLTNLLQQFPENLSARWLLNIASMTVGDDPARLPEAWRIPSSVFDSAHDIRRFPEIAAGTGLAVQDLSGGSVVEDLDGDDLLDVLVSSVGLEDPLHFLHNNGDGTFSDRTHAAGLDGLTGGLNLVSADFDNDGHVDVLVLRGAWMREQGRHPNSLLRNRGDGTFEDVTESAGILSFHPTQTAVWWDYDGDGWLDLFVGNETLPGGPPHPCELFHNNHDGTFTEVAARVGLAVRAYVKGVASADYDNDGRPDLYLSILGRPNQLLHNDGSGTNGWRFSEVAQSARVSQPQYSFPTWFFDYDNDGWEDLFVAGYRIDSVGDVAADVLGLPGRGERAKLYRNRGDGTFEDVTRAVGLDHVLHAMGCNFGDLDNDGWLDFYLGTGDPDLLTLIPNRMFRNAEGRLFQDVTTSGGFGHLQKGHAVSFADLDNDGDQDVFENLGGAVSGDTYPDVLFANPGHGNHWIQLKLVGVKANRSAIGARVKVTVGGRNGTRLIHRTVSTGGSFGCNPLRQEIGIGDATAIREVEIRWPGSGTVQRLSGLEPDRAYEVREGAPAATPRTLPRFSWPTPHMAPGHVHTP